MAEAAIANTLLATTTGLSVANRISQHKAMAGQVAQQNQMINLQRQQANLQYQQNRNDMQKQLAKDISTRNNVNHAFGLSSNSGSALSLIEKHQQYANNDLNMLDIDHGLTQRKLQSSYRRKPAFISLLHGVSSDMQNLHNGWKS